MFLSDPFDVKGGSLSCRRTTPRCPAGADLNVLGRWRLVARNNFRRTSSSSGETVLARRNTELIAALSTLIVAGARPR